MRKQFNNFIIKKAVVATLLLLVSLLSYAQKNTSATQNFKIKEIGIPFIENFSSEDYDGSNQVWSITQDTSGLMYFGLQNRLLEYDGVSFKSLINDENSSFRVLESSIDNQVFYGNYNVFGRLNTDSLNTTSFESLQSLTGIEVKEIGRVKCIVKRDNQLLVQSFNAIFLIDLNDKSCKTIASSKGFVSITLINNRIFAINHRKGIYELKGDSLVLQTGFEGLVSEKIFNIIPFTEKEYLLIGRNKLFKYDDKGIHSWNISIEEEFGNTYISSAIDINGQYTSIATWDNGLFIIDRNGKLIQRLTKENGLPSRQIYTQYLDSNNSLWLGTSAGISHIFLESPLTILDDKSGIEGSVLRIIKHNGYLYVATQQGTFYKKLASPWQSNENTKPFRRLQNHLTDSWWFEVIGDDLFSASRDGLLLIDKENYKIIYDTPMSFISFVNDTTLVAIGGQGVYKQYLFKKKNETWNFVKDIKGLDDYADRIHRTKSGKYWHSNEEVGLFSYHYDTNFDSTLLLTKYGEKDGISDLRGNVVFDYQNEPIFGTHAGLMKYDEEGKFVKYDGFDEYFNNKYVFKFIEFENNDIFVSVEEGKMYLSRIADSESKLPHRKRMEHSIELKSDPRVEELKQKGYRPAIKYEAIKAPFKKVANYNSEFIYAIADKSILIATSLGALHYDAKMDFELQKFNTNIRSVHTSTNGDSLIYGGIGVKSDLKLSYADNALKFTFAATFYDESDKSTYSYQLKGFEDTWSDWNSTTKKEYTNLSYGDYSFLVKSKNIYNKIGATASFEFSILPPWYFTYWAYASYVFIFTCFIWVLLRLNSRRLEREKLVLEGVITERTSEIRTQKESIEKQAKKLSELDKVKSRFFANISHELRTPITLINSPIDAMLKGEYGSISDTLNDGLTVVKNNGKGLLSLVNEILDLTKLEAGKMKLTENPVKLYDLLYEIYEAYQEAAKSRYIKYELNYHFDKETALMLDEAKFSKIINNLLSNAFKFTPDKGTIAIEVKEENNELSISVKDSGTGIHPDDIEYVFDRFYQSEQAESKAQGGTGIGLALSKELCKLQGGNLSVTSQLGKGSEFVFTFKAEFIDLEDEIVLVEKVDISLIKENLSDTITKYIDVFEIDKPKILLTEDHPEMRAFIAKIVSPYFMVLEAKNGLEALEIMGKNQIDLIISDVMMPKMDGFQLLERIKKSDNWKNISMIMLTARAAEEDKLFALTLGVDDYLTKPFNHEELLIRAKNILSHRIVRKLSHNADAVEPETNVDIEFTFTLKKIIEKNIVDSLLSVSYLASEVALSERQLQRKIKNLTGFSPIQFINEVKLQRAKKLLESNQVVSVSEASYRVGFDNVSYFSSQFIKRFGKLPSETLSS